MNIEIIRKPQNDFFMAPRNSKSNKKYLKMDGDI